jgi:hypothetical protein
MNQRRKKRIGHGIDSKKLVVYMSKRLHEPA